MIVIGKNTRNAEECASKDELAKLIISMLVMMMMAMVTMIMMMIMAELAMVMMFTSNCDKNAVENDKYRLCWLRHHRVCHEKIHLENSPHYLRLEKIGC